MRTQVIINWGISSFYGWGVYGLNLALQWINDPNIHPICSRTIRSEDIQIDPLRKKLFQLVLDDSRNFDNQLREHIKTNSHVQVDVPLLMPLGDDFVGLPTLYNNPITGIPNIGVTFFENGDLSEAAVQRAKEYPWIVTGSSWNEKILRQRGINRVSTILQGVDTTLFHPAPRSGLFGDRFLMFSGGKLEFRKGQDLVLEAAAQFTRKYPDAILVTAWHSPWPQTAKSMRASPRVGSVPLTKEGNLDTPGWARQAGIPDGQFLDLGAVPNSQLPPILREMDVGIFPNRCEGGTNLVAMECMACGVPVILSANTGHLDIATEDNCYRLYHQSRVPHQEGFAQGLLDWGESSVAELLEHLETIYHDRVGARQVGSLASQFMSQMTWKKTADALRQVVVDQTSDNLN